MTQALVMAGGRSERMRATLGPAHKALVPVLGVPLVERNLCAVLGAGIRDIVVAVNPREPQLADYVATYGQALARACRARIECFEEQQPLGTIGAAGAVEIRSDALLVVNVDNLTALDLRVFVDHHRASAAALTIATHFERFQVPFGEVVVNGEWIEEYREKPQLPVRISSGTYVVSRRARQQIAPGERLDVPDFFRRLRAAGEHVGSFAHQASWIDVNDATALRLAETMVAANSRQFECWSQAPAAHVVDLAACDRGLVLVEHAAPDGDVAADGGWRLPAFTGAEPPTPGSSFNVRRWIEALGIASAAPATLIAAYDTVDLRANQIVRRHLFRMDVPGLSAASLAGSGRKWAPWKSAEACGELSVELQRSFRLLEFHNGQADQSPVPHQQVVLRRA
jgi:dTDP-glucose pyrophosphorylase